MAKLPLSSKSSSVIPLKVTKDTPKIPSQQHSLLLPVGLARKPSEVQTSSDKLVQKSSINPTLKIPQTLVLLDLPPPTKETIETYRSPDKSLLKKPLPILKDAKELDVFTRYIPKQEDIDQLLKVLKA